MAAGLAAITLALLAFVRLDGEIYAQAPAAERVNVVFAIDNSGSMRGSGGSDPDGQRLLGISKLVDVVRAFLRSSGETRDLRFGAVSFGETVEVLSALRPVGDDDLVDSLSDEDKGATNFRGALCASWVTVTQMTPPPEAGCDLSPAVLEEARAGTSEIQGRRIVVIITDGSPAPGNTPLELDGVPSATSCDGYDPAEEQTDGDVSLCEVGNTWHRLTDAVDAELIVIGLDVANEWFADAEPYWQRAARCGNGDAGSCAGRVVRAVDPEQLARLILGVLVEICDRVASEYTCQVPGGLASVGFLVTGIDSSSETLVTPPGQEPRSSQSATPEFRKDGASIDSWRFARPTAGRWVIQTDALTGPALFVDYHAARFEVEVEWSEGGGRLSLESGDEVHAPSVEGQPYLVQFRQGGEIRHLESIRMTHIVGERFEATVDRVPDGSYELLVFLDLAEPAHDIEVGRAELAVRTSAATPTPSPALPASCEVRVTWAPAAVDGAVPYHQLGAQVGLPLSFRVPIAWEATLTSEGCERLYDVDASVELGSGRDCGQTCSASVTAKRLPLTLRFNAPRGPAGASATRRVHWVDAELGHEDVQGEPVVLEDSFLVASEPVWRWAPNVILVSLALAGVSALAVRGEQKLPDGSRCAPNHLEMIDRAGWAHPVVRLGTFAFRAVPDADDERGWVTMRWLVAGPLVVRSWETASLAAFRSLTLIGEPLDGDVPLLLCRRRAEEPHGF